MAIAYLGEGTVAAGTTSCTPGYPASLTSGDVLVLCVATKHPPNEPQTPSGWTRAAQGTGGSGAEAADSGNSYGTIFYKISDGTETGTLTVDATSASVIIAQIHAYTIDGTPAFGSCQGGDVGVGTTTFSVTYDADPDIQSGDHIIQAFGTRSDITTASTHTLTCTGVTFGTITEAEETGSTNGNDTKLIVVHCEATAGTSSAAPVATLIMSASAGSAGGAALLRIRETSSSTSPISGSSSLTFSTSGALTGKGALSGSSSLSFTASGALTNATPSAGSISGSASLTFTCSGVLTNATPEESTQFGVGGGGSAWNGKLHRIKQDDEQVMKLVIEAFSKLVA